MEIRRELLSNIFTGILVFCAVIITALTVHQYLSSRQNGGIAPRHLKEWGFLVDHRNADIGDGSATLKIIEFSDYQCPYCRELEPNLKRLVEKNKDRVAVIRYDYPLKIIHEYAYKAAIASKCAAAQGVIGPFEEELFQTNLATANWAGMAQKAGISNVLRFSKCVDTKETAALVDADIKAADQIGVRETLTLVINGDIIPGMETSEALNNLILGSK